MSISEQQICLKALLKWGSELQVMMLIEEMAELQKEICKAHRNGVSNKANIAEEIADVEIMLTQMKILYCISYETEEWKVKKLERLKKMIEQG